jgi:hypothetical protein
VGRPDRCARPDHLDHDTAGLAREYLPQFRFLLDDLAKIDERALQARPLTPPARLTLLLLKIAAGNRGLADDLGPWADDLRATLEGPGGVDDFVALLTYIETVGEAPASELDALFAQLGTEAEEAYVTTAEMLRAEGEARGRAKSLVQILTLKFGPLPQSALGVVHAGSTDQLETWTSRVLTAHTLDDVLH